jgi:hypothetical protein
MQGLTAPPPDLLGLHAAPAAKATLQTQPLRCSPNDVPSSNRARKKVTGPGMRGGRGGRHRPGRNTGGIGKAAQSAHW